jgi:hypothetical protein
MRHALVVSSVLLAALAVLAIACGGSSSETPWPIEPPPSVMAPPSELAPTPIVIDDDAGAKPRK